VADLFRHYPIVRTHPQPQDREQTKPRLLPLKPLSYSQLLKDQKP